MFPHSHSSLRQLDRRERVSGLLPQWERVQNFLAVLASVAGALILFGACLYRRLWHPEWTGGQALEALWPFYLAGALPICIAWYFGDAENGCRR